MTERGLGWCTRGQRTGLASSTVCLTRRYVDASSPAAAVLDLVRRGGPEVVGLTGQAVDGRCRARPGTASALEGVAGGSRDPTQPVGGRAARARSATPRRRAGRAPRSRRCRSRMSARPCRAIAPVERQRGLDAPDELIARSRAALDRLAELLAVVHGALSALGRRPQARRRAARDFDRCARTPMPTR